MKKKYLVTVLLIGCLFLPAWEGNRDKELLEKAKLLIFDKKWQDASILLRDAIDQYPKSAHFSSFLFYRAQCLQELKQWKDSLELYERFIGISRNQSLKEEAQVSRVAISFELYKNGKREYLQNVLDQLRSSSKTVRYYAALTLSKDKNKKTAMASVPVLREIIDNEEDQQLIDLAKIALLRVDPDSLKEPREKSSSSSEVRMLKLEITEKGKPDKVFLQVPMFLADLLLNSLDEEAKESIRKEGYNIDQILKNLSQKRGVILEIRDGDSHIKIWIE